MTSRRAFLLATAGGWAVGQLAPPPRGVEGKTLGASHEIGHILRDGGVDAPFGAAESCDVAVVGGGVAGLSAAWRLAPSGASVRVLELEPFPGGTSSWGESGVVAHPWGAHYLPAPNREARATLRLLEEMGVVEGYDAAGDPRFDPRALVHAPEERLFFRGAWHPGLVPTHALDARSLNELRRFTDEVDRLTELRGVDGRYAFHIPLSESSRDPDILALDRIDMAEWLDREGYVTPFLRWYVRYATLDDFGGDPEDVSAWAGLHYFAARKLRTPELEGSHFLAWPEGNGRLVRALMDRSAADVTTSALALSITPGGARSVEVTWLDVRRWERRVLRARAVVLAVPAFVAARLLPSAALPRRASSPWLVANLHVERPLDPDHAWDSVIYDAAGLGYVDASHQLTPPRDRTVLTYFRAFGSPDAAATRAALMHRSWAELAAMVFDDLAPAHPRLDRTTSRIDVIVWGHAMPRPRPGFLGEAPFSVGPRLAPGVAWAHVDVVGMALFEEAQRAGVLAAEAAASDAGLELGATWA